MDINDLRGLSTLLFLIAFIGLCIWAYSPKRKEHFTQAANSPFVDEPTATNESEKDGSS